MNLEAIEKQYDKLKKELLGIGIPIPGTIHKSFRSCGKKGCRCQESKELRHGPYYVWYGLKNNKQTTKSIKAENIFMYQKWIKNRENIEDIVKKMLDLGIQYMNLKKNDKFNSKKRDHLTRGK